MSDGVTGLDLIYLDYNATAPLRPEALDAATEAMRSGGNASSTHRSGRDAAVRVDSARARVAELLGCSAGEIVFTSGATEANNLALRAAYGDTTTLVTSAVEHPAVLETARALTADQPESLILLSVDRSGRVDTDALLSILSSRAVSIVSMMAANNETGVLTDLGPIVAAAHEAGVLVHTDATQMIGRLPLDLAETDVDLLSLSAHKFGGPQGVGALFIRRAIPLTFCPLLTGGGQERGWRAGTLNVAGIAGAGAAAEAARLNMAAESHRVKQLRDALEQALVAKVSDCFVNGMDVPRLPGVSSVTFRGAPADAVLAAMPSVAASEGSACSAGAPSPSHVLLGMGLSREEADATVRFSLGHATTSQEIDQAIETVIRAVEQVRTAMT